MNNSHESKASSPHQSPQYQTPHLTTDPHELPDNGSPFSSKGRFSRYSYFGWNGLLSIFMFALVIIGVLLSPNFQVDYSLSIISWLIVIVGYFIFTYLIFIVIIRRLHDLDKSGWLSLLSFVPLANVGLSIYLIFFKGTEGPNRFGPPRPALGWEKFMAWAQIVIFILAFAVAIGFGVLSSASQSSYQLEQRMEQAL